MVGAVAYVTVTVDICNSVPDGYYDDDNDDPDLVSFTFTGPDYNPALSEGFTLNSIFQVLCFVVTMLHFLTENH